MPSFVEELQQLLPLTVTAVDVDADGIALSGNCWRLRVNTNWRVTRDGVLVLSSELLDERETRLELERLVGDNIIDVGIQPRVVGLDLCMTTRAGTTFEICSDFPYGEWILSAWSPGDKQRIPIYDVEGPVSPDLA